MHKRRTYRVLQQKGYALK